MTDFARPTPTAAAAPPQVSMGRISRLAARPASLLVLLSALFGVAMVLLNPPLRGPDEQAHFVRVYAYTQGVILPQQEVDGRKGIHLPADLYDDYTFFNDQRGKIWTPGFHFGPVYEEYRARRAATGTVTEDETAQAPTRPPVFVAYEGSEGYTPAAYAPHIVGALIARALGIDFVATIQMMRLAGLAAFTAIAAYAIALTPHFKWAFFLIALLPASLYGRAVVGADGATLSLSMLVVALSLRAALGFAGPGPGARALWMTLCVLAKPPQIVFVLMEGMVSRWRDLPRHWRRIALVVAPGLILSPLWIWAVNAEMAAWRLYASGEIPREYFSFSYKLAFMLENPLHFPAAMLTTLTAEAFGLWRQLIGVLGWLDTHLALPAYVAISLTLALTFVERVTAAPALRWRIAFYAAATLAAYLVVVFLIFFITWTPPTEPGIWGVQGRYFLVILPLVAVMVGALLPRGLPAPVLAIAAILGAAISGVASLEGLWRVNWAG